MLAIGCAGEPAGDPPSERDTRAAATPVAPDVDAPEAIAPPSTWELRLAQQRAVADDDARFAPHVDGGDVVLERPRVDGESDRLILEPSGRAILDLRDEDLQAVGVLAVDVLRIGRGDASPTPAETRPEILGRRVDVKRANGVAVEWWRALPGGFEHGIDLAARPAGDGPLSIDIAVDGADEILEIESGVAFFSRGVERARYEHLVVRDADGARLAASMSATDGGVRLRVDDDGARYPIVVDPLLFVPEATLQTTGVSVENDNLGWSVAVSTDGLYAIVGAIQNVPPGSGLAVVYRWNGSRWLVEAVLKPADAAIGDSFGNVVAISSDGSRAIIGSPLSAGGAGNVRIFVRSGTTWTQEVKLVNPVAGFGQFGVSVAMSDDATRVVVGSQLEDTAGGTDAGAARVYLRTGSSWAVEATLVAFDGAASDLFGCRISLTPDASRAVVAARSDDVAGIPNAGSARVFRRSGATWTEEATLLATGRAADDNLGSSVALSADGLRAIVGAALDDTAAGADAGTARVFVRAGTTWSEEAALQASDGAASDQLGFRVALSADGTRAVAGVASDDVGASANAGTARVFVRAGSTWSSEATLVASDAQAGDQLGASLAFASSGTMVFVGAPFDATDAGPSAGSVRTFVRSGSTWTAGGRLARGDRSDGLGSSVALSADGSRAAVGAFNDDEAGFVDGGSIRIFARTGATWNLEALLIPSGISAADQAGRRTALAGDATRVLISLKQADVRVFARVGSAWTEESTLPGTTNATAVALDQSGTRALVGVADQARFFVRAGASWSAEGNFAGGSLGGSFGQAVAMSADGAQALVGAPFGDGGGLVFGGFVQPFARSGSTWIAGAKFVGLGVVNGDTFGGSVALSSDGTRALIGLPGDDTPSGANAGSAIVFSRNGAVWSEGPALFAPDAAATDRFGADVAISADGSRALIHASTDMTVAGMYGGSAHLFMSNGTTWSEHTQYPGASGGAVSSLAMSADGVRVALGDAFADDYDADVGAVRVFTVNDAGAACGAATSCTSGFCVDGVCCDSACGGGAVDCAACSVAAGALVDGTCAFASAATVCRLSAGACDVEETCSGASAACPLDAAQPDGAPCGGGPIGDCDLQDTCSGATGATATCVANLVMAGTVCRAAAGQCDASETCTGASPACPMDGFFASGLPCDDATSCTTGDACDGAGTCGAGAPLDCDDANECTNDGCDAVLACFHVDVPDGQPCANGLCDGGVCGAMSSSSSATSSVASSTSASSTSVSAGSTGAAGSGSTTVASSSGAGGEGGVGGHGGGDGGGGSGDPGAGCSCESATSPRGSAEAILALVGLAMAFMRRRYPRRS